MYKFTGYAPVNLPADQLPPLWVVTYTRDGGEVIDRRVYAANADDAYAFVRRNLAEWERECASQFTVKPVGA